MRVLVIEDEQKMADLIKRGLEEEGIEVETAYDGDVGFEAGKSENIDLIILDLNLPVLSGLEVCRVLRSRPDGRHLPIIMLTARSSESDRVAGLELGADDYVTKPFSPRELLARIRAVLRRYQTPSDLPARDGKRRAYRFAGWEFNLRTRKLTAPDGRKLELSNSEFSLLVAFCGSAQRVLSRDQLMSLSRLHNAEVYDRTVDVQIVRLRRKIEADPARPQLIVTERGAGYIFVPAVESMY